MEQSDVEGTQGTRQVSQPQSWSWGMGVGETLCLRSCDHHGHKEKPRPRHLQADMGTELRDHTDPHIQILASSGHDITFGVPGWRRHMAKS